MKIENINPEIEALLESRIGFILSLTIREPLAFNYHGELGRGANGYTIQSAGGIEITFQSRDVKKIYTDPVKNLSIYF